MSSLRDEQARNVCLSFEKECVEESRPGLLVTWPLQVPLGTPALFIFLIGLLLNVGSVPKLDSWSKLAAGIPAITSMLQVGSMS